MSSACLRTPKPAILRGRSCSATFPTGLTAASSVPEGAAWTASSFARMRSHSAWLWSIGDYFACLLLTPPECAGELPMGGQESLSIRTTDVMYSSLQDAFSQAGMTLRPLVAISEEPLIKYKVHDATRTDGSVSRRLLSVVQMSKPTFHSALPQLSVTVAFNSSDVLLEASSVRDVRRFEARLRHGRWLADDASQPEVVLPLHAAARLFPNQPASAGSAGR